MQLVTLYTTGDHFKALSAKAALESNGIDCLFPDQFHGSIQPHLALGMRRFTILVNEDHAEEAKNILVSIGLISELDVSSVETAPTLQSYACPQCGSRDYHSISSIRSFFESLLQLVVMMPFNTTLISNKCRS